jgi:CRISPR-associated protein Csy1
MEQVTSTMVKEAIQRFLAEQLNRKLEPEQKSLEKAQAAGNSQDIVRLQETIVQLKQRYALENWMDDAANRMARQLKFGTHIAKGVHPDAKGDNVNFSSSRALPLGVLGSQSVLLSELDANGNAAALPLASFFNINIGSFRLRELILAKAACLKGCFSDDENLSAHYLCQFEAALSGASDKPCASELNKQLLWPLDGAGSIASDCYLCLIPLHPSALSYHLYQTINGRRFSEENKQARENRKKKSAEQRPYLTLQGLAYQQLGGTKPQNISQLVSGQRGRNYLLPSLPPQITTSNDYRLTLQQTTLFNDSLKYHCYRGLNELFAVISSNKNTMEQREKRKEALDLILMGLFSVAKNIQRKQPAGWSRTYSLTWAEKYWLDPGRADLDGEETFRQESASKDWNADIERMFSEWLNQILKNKFPQLADDMNDAEMLEWRREMREAIKASRRKQEGLF